jgi:hypothetical protein
MTTKRYKVMILKGTKRPEFVQNVGWFKSPEEAEAWCERKRIGHTPVDCEWAVGPRRDDEVHVLPPGSDV